MLVPASMKPQELMPLSKGHVRRHFGPYIGMAPKRKPKPSTSRPPTGGRTGRRSNTPQPRRNTTSRTNTPRRNPREAPLQWTEWFPAFTGEVDEDTITGPLDSVLLSPQTLLGTPYATRCAHHTHRVEGRWELRAYTTCALTTRARFAIIILPDPDYSTSITEDMAWSAVSNGMGTMVSTAQQTSTSRTFRVQTATNRYSNALPAANASTLGYAAGVMIIYTLQPPIGTETGNYVSLKVMMRCEVKPVNPVPGFGLWESGLLTHPTHPDKAPDWTLGIRPQYINKVSKFMYQTGGAGWVDWCVSHVGNIPLAGGIYMIIPVGTDGRRPQFGQTDNNNAFPGKSSVAEIYDNIKYGCTYVTNVGMPPWENNRRVRVPPKYFACIKGGISGLIYLVGFTTPEQAENQVEGRYTHIPAGAELALRYSDTPIWTDCFPTASVPSTGTDASGGSTATDVHIGFWAVYTSPYSGSIYSENFSRPRMATGFQLDVPQGRSARANIVELDDDPMEGPSGVSRTPNYTPPPPTAPDWSSDSSEDGDQDCCPEHMYGGVLEHDPRTLSDGELAEQYAAALQAVELLEQEAERRRPTEPAASATPVAEHAYARGSLWCLLRAALTRRRRHLV
nr:hypothetical protein 3 [Mute swan feces associated tombus-like virus 5]